MSSRSASSAASSTSGESSPDLATSRAFANSWLHCFSDAPYTEEQVVEWLAPITPDELAGRSVLELGCGSGGLLRFTAEWAKGGRVVGVELGESIEAAARLLADRPEEHVGGRGQHRGTELVRDDLIHYGQEHPGEFDLVYCIGVLHHLDDPAAGFAAVWRATAPGGRFHCWVYGHEGNAVVRWLVDPLRRVASHLPWWLNKWGVAFPLSIPFFFASRVARLLPIRLADRLPLGAYLRWIGRREFAFHHHVAFDQLVTPRTHYLRKSEIERWLGALGDQLESSYLVQRNGNSWKFGGRRRGT